MSSNDDRPLVSPSLFALPPLAQLALGVVVVAAVVAVLLLVGKHPVSAAKFRAEASAICRELGRQFVPASAAQPGATGLHEIEHDAVVYSMLIQRLNTLSPPAIETNFWHVFIRELAIGNSVSLTMANAARAGDRARLRAIAHADESEVEAPFAYARAKQLGCTSI